MLTTRSARRLAMLMMFVCSALTGLPAAATTIDFDSLLPVPGDGTVNRGCTYSEDGFTLDNLNCGGGGDFKSIHPPNYRYSDSVSFFNNVQLGVTRLTKIGGGTFDLVSIDLDGLNGSATVVPPGGIFPYPSPALFTFIGTRLDATTVTESFTTDHNFPNRQTFTFSALFDSVTQVTWTQDNGYPRPSQQFDNIVVTATDVSSPPPHFLSYKVKTTKGSGSFTSQVVALTDQFDVPDQPSDFEITKPVGLYTPADKNGEGIFDEATHLEAYQIKPVQGEPKHLPRHVSVTNQFHDSASPLLLDTIKPDRLLVPTAKCIDEPIGTCPDPLPAPDSAIHQVDHYKCYTVKTSKGAPKFTPLLNVAVGDQFTDPAKKFDLKKPVHLCNPVKKGDEEIKNPNLHLLCYQAKGVEGEPKHKKRTDLHVSNQFGEERLDTIQEEELCVPSEKSLP